MIDLELPEGIAVLDAPLPGLRIDTPAARGVIYLNGAHVAEWTPAGERRVLWMSEHSVFMPGHAIRGGVPIVWPWFGAGAAGDKSPAHGWARLTQWNLRHAQVSDRGVATLHFGLAGHEVPPDTAPQLPEDFSLDFHVSMGQALMLQLVVTAGAEDFSFEEGLHTYFAVGDIEQVRVEGLEGATYEDRLSDAAPTQDGPITFTGETDRIYESEGSTRIIDQAWQRTILVEKFGSKQTVVWNPWIDKSAAMPDFGDDEWTQMVCVEAVNCRDQSVVLPAGQRHVLSQTISLV